eukprot:TRINITY_DN758_c0_g1_i5.p1 TRINITY_DN758_c0_g1~~TRINITY_DN758_c0_g1_i5.p1  ORF type:complete len:1193 (+),score=167.78 TRINITY_DN758_c0_g1_i5:98-3676(+)
MEQIFGVSALRLPLPDDVLRRVFATLDLADVTLFALTSKQSRIVAVTNFVTSIDMWSLTKFPVDTLLQGFKSLIEDVPASDLRKITSWRMPWKGGYSTSLAFSEPILCNLTSLHALEPSNTREIENSRIDFVLEHCTSLTQLYYTARDSAVLEKYFDKQPKLQALAVSVEVTDREVSARVCERVTFLFEQLQHRPETVCILSLFSESFFVQHPGWARDAKRVIVTNQGSPDGHPTIPESIEWHVKTYSAPLKYIWSLRNTGLEPFATDALPIVAELIADANCDAVTSGQYIFDSIKAFMPSNQPEHIWAAAFRYMRVQLQKSPRCRPALVLDLIRCLIAYARNTSDTSSHPLLLQWIPLMMRGIPSQEHDISQFLAENRLPLTDVEWKLARLESMFYLEDPRESIAALYELPLVERCLFTGNPSLLVRTERLPETAKQIDQLIQEGNHGRLLELWNRFPFQLERMLPDLFVPRELVNGFTFSNEAIFSLLKDPAKLGLSCKELFERPDVEHCLVRTLSSSNWKFTKYLSPDVSHILMTSTRIVSRLLRRARVFPFLQPTIAAWMYAIVFPVDKFPAWKCLKQYLDEQLVLRAKGEYRPVELFWRECEYGLWSQPTFLANFITHGGMPEEFHRVWDVLVRTEPMFRSDLHETNANGAYTLRSLRPMVRQELVDPQRFCKMFFVRHNNLADIEDVAATEVPLDSPWAPLLIDHLLQIWSPQLISAHEGSPQGFPKAIKEIMKWCTKPVLAEIVVSHLSQVIWMDSRTGIEKDQDDGNSLLEVLVAQGHMESAFFLIDQRAGVDCPTYDIDGAKLEPYANDVMLSAYILSRCAVYMSAVTSAAPKNVLNELDKRASSLSNLPDEVKTGLWMFFVGARNRMPERKFESTRNMNPRHLKLLVRMSTDALTRLRNSMDANIVTAYLCLMAAQNNWDGFLGSAVYLQKQQYSSADIKEILDVAVMIAFYKMGSMEKAKKAAAKLDPDFGPGLILEFLDAEKIWQQLKKQSTTTSSLASSSSSSSSAQPLKKKKRKSKKAAPEPASSTSSSSSSRSSSIVKASVGVSLPEETGVQYEPDSKPAKQRNAPPHASSVSSQPDVTAAPSSHTSSSTSSSQVEKKAPATPTKPAEEPLRSGPAGMVFAECPICYDRLPDCGIYDCGHMFCLECIRNLSVCSICRQPIGQWRQFFFSQGVPDIED